MQLAYLIPHLDAEINRLQKARDLLALVPTTLFTFISAPEQTAGKPVPVADVGASQLPPKSDAAIENVPQREAAERNTVVTQMAAAAPSEAPAPALAASHPEPTYDAASARVRRVHASSGQMRPGRRRRLMVFDTALRGPVPTGPVVISAEQVRKSQAAKAEQAVRSAEVRKAGADLVSTFGWRSRPTDMQNVDTLLQRLISIGEENSGPMNAGELGRSNSLSRAPLASKLD